MRRIVATTLVTRAAIRGGMIPEAAYSLSDYYIQAVENGTDIHEVQDIHQNMFRDFIARVHKIREAPKLSLPIQSCQAYIQQHLGEKLPGKYFPESAVTRHTIWQPVSRRKPASPLKITSRSRKSRPPGFF